MTTMRFTDVEMLAVVEFLAAEAGLVFDEGRRPGLTAILAERMAESRSSSLTEYLALVSGPDGRTERQRLLDDVTIQETFFFRNAPQMEALRSTVLPDLVMQAVASKRPLRIWSAGCSTGEEPYTLAMLALEVSETLGVRVEVQIVGTDVSASAVNRARSAKYVGRSVDLAEAAARERWFDVRPDGVHIVHEQVRELVDVRVHNLILEPPPFDDEAVDLVVCRNVTIYFARPTTAEVIASFHRVLRPNGYLLLGHAESLWQVTEDFTLLPVGEAFVYQRGPAPVPRVEDAAPAELVAAVVRAPELTPRRTRIPGPRAAAPIEVADSLRSPRPKRSAAPEASGVRPSAVDELIGLAEAALAQGDYDAALRLAAAVVDHDSLSQSGHVLSARAHTALGQDGPALGRLRKAVYLDPTCAEAHFLLADVLMRLDQRGMAAASYRAAAGSVLSTPEDRIQRLLDGRDVQSFVELCMQLGDAAERSVDVLVQSGSSVEARHAR